MNLISLVKKYFNTPKTTRYRDRRSFYASGLAADIRDLYWEAIGEPPTNPPEYVNQFKMKLGKWIEVGFINDIVRNLHWFGLHAIGDGNDQVSIGFSDPNVDGNLDGLLCERIADKYSKPVVLEVKTIYSTGADILYRSLEPKDEHLAQMGGYLRDLSSKNVTNEGMIVYILISDNNFGEMIQFDCSYNDGEILVYQARKFDGETKELDIRKNIGMLVERLKKVEDYVKRKELPPAEHVYKKPLTTEFISSVSDNELRKAIDGEKILGDWQIRYSRYFSKHLKVEGASREYTPDELELLRSEYEKRHPKTRKYKKAVND